MVRTEIHGAQAGKDKGLELMTACALNEWDSRLAESIEYRRALGETRVAAVIAAEHRNNGHKLAKWTAQAMLAGATNICLGFVSRTGPLDFDRHEVLAVKPYKVMHFARQIMLTPENIWGVVRTMLQPVLDHGDGLYAIRRDVNRDSREPTRDAVRVYKIIAAQEQKVV